MVAPALQEQVVRKMGRLDKYLDRLQGIDVELYVEQTRDAAHRNHVEATAHVPGQILRVATEHGDMRAALDQAVDRLYRRLNRRKERIKTHHAAKPAELVPQAEEGGEEVEITTEPVVEVERLEMKPLFEDEAIQAMETLGREFYVFLNARSEQVNVIYRRTDGVYGLIAPKGG
jgi:putative sigma-54 modulation protein